MSAPMVSVVIPTLGRPQALKMCLESLALIDYESAKFEVIVVDDGSPSPLDAVLAPFVERLNIRSLRQQNSGPAQARNAGVAQARGELIAFLDDDCCAAPDWLGSLAKRHVAAPDALIGGRTVNALGHNIFSSASQMLVSYLYEHYNPTPGNARFFCSNNIAVPAELFREIGGFDAKYSRIAAAEDRMLCDKWQQHGLRLVFAPDAIIYHAHPLSLNSFWRQHFAYGKGAYNFRRRHSEFNTGAVKFEGWSFYWRLLNFPFRRPREGNVFGLAALLVVSQVANLAGFFWEALFNDSGAPRQRWVRPKVLPF